MFDCTVPRLPQTAAMKPEQHGSGLRLSRRLRMCKMAAIVLALILLVAPATALAAPSAQSGVYIVKRGDTLGNIAARFGVSSTAIARTNGISNPNFVWVGQRLVIPGRAVSGTSSGGSSAGGVYIVQRGDTLARVAARNGTTVARLMGLNGIRNANLIYAGQRIALSGAGGQAPAANRTPAQSSGARWIDVNLSRQTLTAYEGDTAVFSSLISGGLPSTPTVVGRFVINTKLASQTMSGPGYWLPNVPYVMYFYRGYAIHGTYWHNNFGNPMSHGCVNLPTSAAAWVYNWAGIGTPVVTHW